MAKQTTQFQFFRSRHIPELTVLKAAMNDSATTSMPMKNTSSPIATIQFPAVGIHGVGLIVWSLGLAALAIGAPGSYALVGAVLRKRVEDPVILKGFSLTMSALLIAVSLSIGYEHVWLPLSAGVS
jgi:hypothetical protein